MNYAKEIEAVVDRYTRRIINEWEGDEPFPDHLKVFLRAMANDVSIVVRDAVLRFHEARKEDLPVPPEIAALPLFQHLMPVPQKPPGSFPGISAKENVHGKEGKDR